MHGASRLPELYLHQGKWYFQSFCLQLNRLLSDKVHFAFSSAFTLPPDQGKKSEVKLVLDDAWFHPITQDKDGEVSIPTCISCENSTAPSIDFGLVKNLIYKYRKGGNEAVVYEGASADGLVHPVCSKYGSKHMVYYSNIYILNQSDLSNIPSTPLDYRNKVSKGLSYDKAQALAWPRALSPLQK